MGKAPRALRDEVERLHRDIAELENHFDGWDSGSAEGGRRLWFLAKRINLQAKRVETLVSENTYHAGGIGADLAGQ